MWVSTGICLSLATLALARSQTRREFVSTRRITNASLEVDLDYEVYDGYYDNSTDLNIWKGIRYAAPPVGNNRWRAPQSPTANRSQVLSADAFGPHCPGALEAPTTGGYSYAGDEDCLFLSVYSPAGASDLPVLALVHGGGYGSGAGTEDVSTIANINDNGFVSVVMQYRLGAFGFLSSDEVRQFGVVNAGLLDQHFALQWIQKHIHKFGGDASHVTLGGESSGAGSAMLQAMAYGGTLRDSLFENVIAASPFLPMQHPYNGWQPSQAYYAFAQNADCFPGRAHGNTSTTVLDCLRQAPSDTLQTANAYVSASGTWGTWAFLPVTDGDFLRQRPSAQLPTGRVNGKRVLTGNNAAEGAYFVIPEITSDSDFEAWVRLEYPMLTARDYQDLFTKYYTPLPANSNSSNIVPQATCGDCNTTLTAVNVGPFSIGPQQRAYNLYAETTFVCPSYWLASAFQPSGNDSNEKEAYKYQFSIPPAVHGADNSADSLGTRTSNVATTFYTAFATIWGNFITENNPSITSALANGDESAVVNAASEWPVFLTTASNGEEGVYRMLNLNETGGTPTSVEVVGGGVPNATEYEGSSLRNDIQEVDAYSWEGGRGARCEFWRRIGARVPE
ncbi:hypothetical protein B0A50_04316 [Salinomyces thailandicus]|uniref:Carboxylic ester hydrolase n=1 Tax=Salinomyces thailandicus TaxID=706561 RepID=A0A4U0TWS3_9PEZI|nr:hypothetical protein B0A50_04316 [Salinomyces thailandica]